MSLHLQTMYVPIWYIHHCRYSVRVWSNSNTLDGNSSCLSLIQLSVQISNISEKLIVSKVDARSTYA